MKGVARENGYIELEKLFQNSECKLIDWKKDKEMKSTFSCSKVKFIFSYLGDTWIYKDSLYKNNEYLELIAEELAHDFQIPCAYYDLAIFKGMKGNLSRNFKKEGVTYISGDQVLKDYIENCLKISIDDFDIYEDAMNHYNSLEGVW